MITGETVIFGPRPEAPAFYTMDQIDRGGLAEEVGLREIPKTGLIGGPRNDRGIARGDSTLPGRPVAEPAQASVGGPAFAPCERAKKLQGLAKRDARAVPHCKRIIRSPMGMAARTDKNAGSDAGGAGTIHFDRNNYVQEFKGTYSGLKNRGTYVIESDADWKAFWEEMSSITEPAPRVPAIDFDKNFAVAVAMGEQTSGGYATMIEAIELEGKVVRVIVHESKPGDEGMGGGLTLALTQPYHVLILPRLIGEERFSTADGFKVQFEYR
jgi:hypothetical protein